MRRGTFVFRCKIAFKTEFHLTFVNRRPIRFQNITEIYPIQCKHPNLDTRIKCLWNWKKHRTCIPGLGQWVIYIRMADHKYAHEGLKNVYKWFKTHLPFLKKLSIESAGTAWRPRAPQIIYVKLLCGAKMRPLTNDRRLPRSCPVIQVWLKKQNKQKNKQTKTQW